MATVNTQHPQYMAMALIWQRMADVCKGQDAVHAAGELYLPRLKDQDADSYKSMVNRTPFYNATWRTIMGLQGMIFRKPAKVDVPPSVEPLLEDITMEGTPLQIFALEATEEAFRTGRVGIFTDFPKVDTAVTTVADAQASNLRPLLRMYPALSIINWKTRKVNNVKKLSMVVLLEEADISENEFATTCETHYRVLDLIDMTMPAGNLRTVYRVRVFKIDPRTDEDVLLDTSFPLMNNDYIENIPFHFIGVDDVSWEVDEPPLLDVANMNLMHYRVTSDYEHGCHFTGLPTPYVCGYTKTTDTEKLYVGSTTAWVFPNPTTKVAYLEFTGQGLKELASNILHKEEQMAVLGARMLETQLKSVESANTAAIHRSGEQSMLATMAQSLSIGIQRALQEFSDFTGAKGTVVYELNRDFFPIPMDALTLTAVIAGWQNSAYSYETMFSNLQEAEVIPPDRNAEQELALIKANPPPTDAVPTTPGDRAGNGPNQGNAPGTTSNHGKRGAANPTITQLQNS